MDYFFSTNLSVSQNVPLQSLLSSSLLCHHWILRVQDGKPLWGGYYNLHQHLPVGNVFLRCKFPGSSVEYTIWYLKLKSLQKIRTCSQSENPHFRGTVHHWCHEARWKVYLLLFVCPLCSWHLEGTQSIFVYKFAHRNTLCICSHLNSIL